jgi:hypothetical protein
VGFRVENLEDLDDGLNHALKLSLPWPRVNASRIFWGRTNLTIR